MKIKLLLLLLIFSASINAQEGVLSDISFGPVVVGENRINLSSKEFEIKIKNLGNDQVRAKLVEDSLQWVRADRVLLSPRMKLAVSVDTEVNSLSATYMDRSLIPQKVRGKSHFLFFVSLFSPSPIKIYRGNKIIAQVEIIANETKNKPLVDYSCAPYDLKVQGLEDQFLSVGCLLIKSGSIGSEKNILEVHWTSPNIRLANGERPPFISNLVSHYPSRVDLVNDKGNKETISFKANVPVRSHRLKTAIGFGPYLMTARHEGQSSQNALTSPLMLYGRYDLKKDTSFRAFNAFFYEESLFNNFGFYFAYDVGKAMDNRFVVTPLLGVQAITYKSEFDDNLFSEVIYPQGFELLYKHAFGLKNYHLVYGMFVSPSSKEDYKNLWMRFGKGVFWEVNYLSWKKGSSYAKAWGLSVGIPFLNFF